MSYIALYRKWRPLVFEDVVEQEHVVKTLRYSVETDRIAHAYLFCGTRGTGKTTMAKIFSRAINCLNPKGGDPCNKCEICHGILSGSILDVVEIDAASNNSVDNIREIRDEVIYAPSQAKHKVYIIDEVHMLSTGAFNALLKTLEEPPPHVVFILATTEPHKLPATILSRCQRYDFRRITSDSIMGRLTDITAKSGISISKDAARLIARMADGALRDAISILDQCISAGTKEIAYGDVQNVVGIVNDSFLSEVVEALRSSDMTALLRLVDRLVMDGKDIVQFVADLVENYRNLMVCKVAARPEDIIELSTEELSSLRKQSEGYSSNEIIYIIKELSAIEASLKWATHPRVVVEVGLIKVAERISGIEGNEDKSISELRERVRQLEKRLEGIHSQDLPGKSLKGQPPGETGRLSADGAGVGRLPADGDGGDRAGHASAAGTAGKEPVPKAKDMLPGHELPCWGEVLADLKAFGRMTLHTYLMGVKAVRLDEKHVGLLFKDGSSYNRNEVAKYDNISWLQDTISKKLGIEVRVKCMSESDTMAKKTEERDEPVEQVREFFGRHNIPVNVIDE